MLKNFQRNFSQDKIDLENILTRDEKRNLDKSKHWLWTIRYLLHEEAKREEDRLLFEHQISIANKLFPSVSNPSAAAE